MVREGLIDAPKIKVGKRGFYKPRKCKRLQRQVRSALKPGLYETLGLYSITAAARALGLPLITLRCRLRKGVVPRPAHDVDGRKLYRWGKVRRFLPVMLNGYRPHHPPVLEKLGLKPEQTG
jgi:hypothetical protein